jgi:putative methyltransferase (TIGR04325 family)
LLGNPIFENKFQSYSECLDYCNFKNKKDGIESFPEEVWKSRQLRLFKNPSQGSEVRLESITEYFPQSCNLEILDFGGGSGWLFEKLDKLCKRNINYTLIETTHSLETFDFLHEDRRKLSNFKALSMNNLKFRDSKSNESVIYVNSVLQYIENPVVAITEVLSLFPARVLILDDFINSELEDFWSCQRYYGHLVPYHFLNLQSFINQIQSLSFDLSVNKEYRPSFSDKWLYKVNFNDLDYDLDQPRTLIFEKN